MELLFTILGSALLVSMILVNRAKQYEYDLWKEEFERELGFSPDSDDETIRELFNTLESPKIAAEYYKDVKEAELYHQMNEKNN